MPRVLSQLASFIASCAMWIIAANEIWAEKIVQHPLYRLAVSMQRAGIAQKVFRAVSDSEWALSNVGHCHHYCGNFQFCTHYRRIDHESSTVLIIMRFLLIQRLFVYWCLAEFLMFEDILQWTKTLIKCLSCYIPPPMSKGIPGALENPSQLGQIWWSCSVLTMRLSPA